MDLTVKIVNKNAWKNECDNIIHCLRIIDNLIAPSNKSVKIISNKLFENIIALLLK